MEKDLDLIQVFIFCIVSYSGFCYIEIMIKITALLQKLNSVKASDKVVEKGTDAGGAVEVYRKLKDAQNRCEYLSEFDGTLLYSGSYTLFGTMVIRTSYQLTNEEQVAVVNAIIEKMTEVG